MNLKKLIMLGCFALSLAACGGSTSQDNNDNNDDGVNPGGDQNPPVVTPVATPVPTPVPTPGEAEVVITDADIDSSPRAVCLEFTAGVCVKKTLCVPADNEAHLVCRNLNYLIPVLLRTDADGTKHYSVCYVAPETPAGLVCHEETVSPPPPAGGGNQGGGAQGNGDLVGCHIVIGQGLVCQDESPVDKCANAAYRASHLNFCGDNAALVRKCQDPIFRAQHLRECRGIPIAARQEAAPAGGNGGSYQLPGGVQLEFCVFDAQGNSRCPGDSDDNDDEQEDCSDLAYRIRHLQECLGERQN